MASLCLGLLEIDLIYWPWEGHLFLVMVYLVYVALINVCETGSGPLLRMEDLQTWLLQSSEPAEILLRCF